MGSRPLRVLLATALGLLATGAFAGALTLYQDNDFLGGRMTAHGAVPDLDRSAFNNAASSAVVHEGIWEVCTGAYFRGRCTQLRPGEYSSLEPTLAGRIESVREVNAYEPDVVIAPPPVTQPQVVPPPPQALTAPPTPDTRIALFERTGFGGRSVELSSSVRDLDTVNFGSRADAVIVYGGVWRLCTGTRARGECRDFAPGRYDNLGRMAERVSSVELVASTSPPAPVSSAAPAPVAPRAVLYEFPNFGGHVFAIDQPDAPSVNLAAFNDRAGSLRIEGGHWLICSGAYFHGDCRTFGPGEYPRLPPELDSRIASVRRIA